jgi:methionyl aminopeptidase
MITNDPKKIELLKKSGQILAQTLKVVSAAVHPGISAWELNEIAEAEIAKAGARPAFKNYKPDKDSTPFPGALCVSVNDEVVHGLPTKDKILKDGDIVGLDLGVDYEGVFTDSAITVPVGKVDSEGLRLIEAAAESLQAGINVIKAGITTGDYGAAVEAIVKKYKFETVRDLVGHGVGNAVQEDPEIPNYGPAGRGAKLVAGMVIAVEPMINAGTFRLNYDEDGWGIRTADGKRSSHMEHTVLVTEHGCEIIT